MFAAVIFLTISLLIAEPGYETQCATWWGNLFLNVGYGTIASIVVTLLVDIGNTARQQKQDKKAFERLNAELRELCAELPSEMYIAVYETFGYADSQKHTFKEWTQKLFEDCQAERNKQEREITSIVQHVSAIHKAASQLKSDIRIISNNAFVDEEYERKLSKLMSACSRLKRNAAEETYVVCIKLITDDLTNAIVALFNDLSADYTRVYNETEYK